MSISIAIGWKSCLIRTDLSALVQEVITELQLIEKFKWRRCIYHFQKLLNILITKF